MYKRRSQRRLLRALTVLAVGGSVFQLGSCDPTVRSTLLTGLATTTEALADTLIQTFFTSLANNNSTGGTGGLTTT